MSASDKKNEIKLSTLFIPFILVIVLILFFPYWFTSYSFRGINFSQTGNIGDTIGGILGPFIAIAAAILTFFAFWVQYKANEQQKLDLKIERFENKFFELLKFHKENVNELTLGENLKGRKTFVLLSNELRTCYKVCEEVITQSDRYANINIMKFSYMIFFYGIGEQSEEYYTKDFDEIEKEVFGAIKVTLLLGQEHYNKNLKNPCNFFLDISLEIFYLPFNGHVSQLSHYYRNLFQSAKYVTEQDETLFNDDQKYDYLKILRAQLSEHEQLLMYYNAISWFDSEWKELFTKYRLIKNLPIPLANFHDSPLIHYSDEIEKYKDKKIFHG
jgi:hypothetical protein